MDFTRQPIIETIIIPKEGYRLVVRSSKNIGQEEFFVEALEVVSFGAALFFRSREWPKAFLVPISDYEVLEIREARMALKAPSPEQSNSKRIPRESNERVLPSKKESSSEKSKLAQKEETPAEAIGGASLEKRGEKHGKRRREREKVLKSKESEATGKPDATEQGVPVKITIPPPSPTLLPPPPTLIAETIARYKENARFRGVFINPEETKTFVNQAEAFSEKNAEDVLESKFNLDLEPTYSAFGTVEGEPVAVCIKGEFDETSDA